MFKKPKMKLLMAKRITPVTAYKASLSNTAKGLNSDVRKKTAPSEITPATTIISIFICKFNSKTSTPGKDFSTNIWGVNGINY